MVIALDPVIAEAQKTDWEKLSREDPIEWARRKGQLEARQNTLAAVQAELKRVSDERHQAHLQEQADLARKAIPALADPEKAKSFKQGVRSYMTGLGFSENEIAGVGDHRVLMALEDAMNWRAHVKAQEEARKKVAAAAKKTALKPNSGDRNTKNAKQLDAKQKRTLRDASLDSAAEVIASLL